MGKLVLKVFDAPSPFKLFSTSQGQTSPRLGRRASVIESSTDTLVPETSDQAAGERSEKEESPAANWTLGGSDLELANGTNGTLPSPGLPQPIPLQQTR